jgi:hypothetical protein
MNEWMDWMRKWEMDGLGKKNPFKRELNELI